MSPVLNGTEANKTKHGHSTQHQQTERPKDQRLLHLYATGKLFPPDKEEDGHARGHLFISLFHFHLFTTNVTRALFLEAIKGEAGATSRAIEERQSSNHTSIHPRTTPHKRPRIHSFSQKLVTPTASTPVQGNTSNHKTHWTSGRLCLNQYTSLCPLCTPSRPRRADINLLVALFRPLVL
jgi:hypothetical protein